MLKTYEATCTGAKPSGLTRSVRLLAVMFFFCIIYLRIGSIKSIKVCIVSVISNFVVYVFLKIIKIFLNNVSVETRNVFIYTF